MDKVEQNLDSRTKGSRSESGEPARLSEHGTRELLERKRELDAQSVPRLESTELGKSLAERFRGERASGELARKNEARMREIIDDPSIGSQSHPLDMRGLLERKRELDRQSTTIDSEKAGRYDRESDPHGAGAMEHRKSTLERLNEERASGELAQKSEAHVKKQVDGIRLDHVYVEGLMERQRIMDQRKV